MKKRILSIMLAICMALLLVPQAAFAEENTSAAPSVSAYATKAQLMDNTFAPDSNGTVTNIGKLVFGKNSSGTSQEWYVLGGDRGVSGDNTIIFAASPIVTGQKFGGDYTNLKVDKEENIRTDTTLWNDCSYTGTPPSIVYLNHYGASDLRNKLQAIVTEYFTQTEQGMMNATTVTTDDAKNNTVYTTTDKLYALRGTYAGISIYAGSIGSERQLFVWPYWENSDAFWLRSPCSENKDTAFHDSCFALYANPGDAVSYHFTIAEIDVRPAGNLDLSNVLFASSAQASSSGTIASGTAMTLRLDGKNKNIGTAIYSAATGDIKATKGSTTGDVALVVQGRNGTTDWYYSKKITGTETVNVSDIESELGLSDIDLSVCKIWLETTNSTERMIYAVEAAATGASSISSVAITGIDTPKAATALDTKAACATAGVNSTAPSVTWTPNDPKAGYNTRYTASVTLTAAAFYQFADSTKATVNGQTAAATKNSDGTLTVTYTFSATAKDKLTSVTAPAPVTVENGTAYDKMNLPETVAIVTEGGTETSASVQWNTTTPASGSYDPAVLTEQKVTLNGTVSCPKTIDANGVLLTTTIAITIKAADFVKAPKADPASGTYSSNQSVTLRTETEGAKIYYTTDGTEPSRTNGTEYTGPISVTGTEAQSVQTTIKAIAVKDKMQDSPVETFTYKIEIPDTTAPTGEIRLDDTNSWTDFSDNITFDRFFKAAQTVTITAGDNSSGAVTIEYLLSDKELTDEELAEAVFTKYTEAFHITPDNKYVIYARLTDESKNERYINSGGIVLDATAPVISGVENDGIYCSAQTVTVTEDHIGSVKVNGEEVTLDTNNQFTLNPAENRQTIVVTDKAGNVSAEMIVTVNAGHTYEWQSENGQYWKKCKYCGAETDKKEIPVITIDGADRVCATQDYEFSAVLPEGAASAVYGYQFENEGAYGIPAAIENNEAKCVLRTNSYVSGENSFQVYIRTETADGFAVSVTKNVVLLSDHTDVEPKDHICDVCKEKISDHSGGEATCTSKAVCEHCGEEYGEIDSSNHDLEHISEKAASVTETGNREYWQCRDCETYFSDEEGTDSIELKDTVSPKLPPEIIKGKGQSITAGEKKVLSFTSNAAFRDFIRVELDGKTLDETNYTAKEGSTIVTLKADCVGALSAGEPRIGIVSESGTAVTTFTVKEKMTADNESQAPQTGDKEIKSPQTGDNGHMFLWTALLFISAFGVLGRTIYRRRKRA